MRPESNTAVEVAEEAIGSSAWPMARLLETLALRAGIRPDPHEVIDAVHRAERARPGEARETWAERLAVAGGRIGLDCRVVRRSVREALREGGLAGAASVAFGLEAQPAIIVSRPQLAGAWVLVGNDDTESWHTSSGLSRALGVSSPAEPVEWVLAEPATPLQAIAGHGDDGHGPSPLTRLRGLLRTESSDVWIVVAYAVCVGLLSLAVPVAVQALVNTVAFGSVLQPVVLLTLLVLAGLGFAGALRAVQIVVVEVLRERTFVRVAADLAFRLPRVAMRAWDRAHGPEVVNRFFDVVTIQKAATSILLDGLGVVLQMVIGLLLLAFYHPVLLAFDLVLLAAVAFMIFVLGRGATVTSIRRSRAKYAMAAWLEELARQPTTFRGVTGAGLAVERADVLARGYVAARRSHFRIVLRQIGAALTIQALASAILLGIGGWLVIKRQLTLGQLVAAELIVAGVLASLAKFGKHLESFYDLLAAMDKIGHLVDLPLERRGGEEPLPSANPAALHLREVSFGYPDGETILSGANLDLHPGARVALVGDSGSGRSTLLDLCFGLRDPQSGTVELDGVPLRELCLNTARAQMALVRDGEIFAGTVEENVRAGRAKVGLAEVREALSAVGLLEEVARLPQGLFTQLNTGGLPLSSGQVRRLALARAILGRPRLLLLDETLDRFDAATRTKLLEALSRPEAPWTLVVATHVPEVASSCERALVIRGGRIEEVAR